MVIESVILLIIISCGVVGGLLNHFSKGGSLRRCLLAGIVAAFVVPLFLSFIGNNLLEDMVNASARADSSFFVETLKLTGFCLVASVASRRFMQTMEERILKIAEDAQEKVKHVEENIKENDARIESIFDAMTEDSPGAEVDAEAIDVQEDKILRAFYEGTIPFRSEEGLSISTGSDRATITAVLESLSEKKLVTQIETYRGRRWRLTQLGSKVANAAFSD